MEQLSTILDSGKRTVKTCEFCHKQTIYRVTRCIIASSVPLPLAGVDFLAGI